jgi:hypothetical protein
MRFDAFPAGDIQVRPFLTSHPDGIILAGLAAPDQMSILTFYPSPFDMPGTVNGMANDLISPGGIIIIDKSNASRNLIGIGQVQGSSGAFYQYFIGSFGKIAYRL